MDDVGLTDGDYDGQEEELQWTDGDYCLLQPLSDEEDVMKMEDKYVLAISVRNNVYSAYGWGFSYCMFSLSLPLPLSPSLP